MQVLLRILIDRSEYFHEMLGEWMFYNNDSWPLHPQYKAGWQTISLIPAISYFNNVAGEL